MKFHLLLTISFIVFLNLTIKAQLHHNWSFGYGSNKSDLTSGSLADDQDNQYIISTIRDTADLDPGPGTTLAIPRAHEVLAFCKFDSEGNFVWARRFHSGEGSFAGMYEVSHSTVTIIFHFVDSLSVENGGNLDNLFHSPGNGMAIINFSLDGELLTNRFYSTSTNLGISKYLTMPDHRILIGGTYQDTIENVFGSNVTLHTPGHQNSFIAIMTPDFEISWIRQFSTADYNYLADLEFIHQRIYFTLDYEGEMDLQTVSGSKSFTSNGGTDFMMGYLDIDGNIQKAFSIGGPEGEEASSIKVDQAQNMYVIGYFEGPIDFNENGSIPVVHTPLFDSDGFLAKYDADGHLTWVRVYKNGDYGGIYSLDLKRGNELYISGTYTLTSDLDPGPDSIIVETGYHSNPFLSKLNLDGDMVWVYPYFSPDVSGILSMNISTTSSRIFLSAFMYDTIHSPTLNTNVILSNGGSDSYMASFSEDNVITAAKTPIPLQANIYPNPTADLITINTNEVISGITLYDMKGGILKTWITPNIKDRTISLTDLAPGTYFVRVESDTMQVSKKIVVQ